MKCPEGINLGRLFPSKPWERIGLVTDSHGDCWNFGFIDGFNHLVYMVLAWFAIHYGLPHTQFGGYTWLILAWLPIIALIIFTSLELYQSYNMRKTQLKRWWEVWDFHRGRIQDILLPVGIVLILNKVMGIY